MKPQTEIRNLKRELAFKIRDHNRARAEKLEVDLAEARRLQKVFEGIAINATTQKGAK